MNIKNILLILGCLLTTNLALANEYPQKPVTMIVAYSPGGGNDTVARLMAQHIETYLGQRVVVENHPGAGGQIGFSRLARAKNDGYTIGLLSAPSITLIELLRKNVGFSIPEFTPIANIQSDPVILAVNSESDYQSVEALLSNIKNNPGSVNIGGDGPQSNIHLQVAAFEDSLNVDVNFISYSGSGPTATALLGNEVEAAFLSSSSATQFIDAGRIKALAVFSENRHPVLPAVPTASETIGKPIPSIGTASRGLAGPKGIDPEKVLVLESAFKKLLQDPTFMEKAKDMNIVLNFMGNKQYGANLIDGKAQAEKYISLMK